MAFLFPRKFSLNSNLKVIGAATLIRQLQHVFDCTIDRLTHDPNISGAYITFHLS